MSPLQKRAASRLLLVEGQEDKRVIPYLVEAQGIPWDPKGAPIVKIEPYDGVENLLAPGEIEAQLGASGLIALGVMVDADNDAVARWMQIRSRVLANYPDAPEKLPEEGVVIHDHSGARPAFGAWIMPDNSQRGMLETFLLHLRPADNSPLLKHANDAIDEARRLGAPYSDAHRDKAQIHSWLAWQDPPGRQLHQAVMERMLRGNSPALERFIAWFRRLYDLPASS